MHTRPAVPKSLIFALCAILATTAALAGGPPPKSELIFGGSLSNPKDGPTSYAFAGEFNFPLGDKGYILAGPGFKYAKSAAADVAMIGAVFTVNFNAGSGFFCAAAGLYDTLNELEGADKHTIEARCGVKYVGDGAGASGLFEAYAGKVVDGFGEDDTIGGAVLTGLTW